LGIGIELCRFGDVLDCLILFIMLLMKRGCRGKKLKQIFKTEPIPDLQIIHEEEPTLIQTKKYLI